MNKGLSRAWFEKIASPETVADFDNRAMIHIKPKCEHDWTGPEVRFDNGWSVSCAKYGKLAIQDDMEG